MFFLIFCDFFSFNFFHLVKIVTFRFFYRCRNKTAKIRPQNGGGRTIFIVMEQFQQ